LYGFGFYLHLGLLTAIVSGDVFEAPSLKPAAAGGNICAGEVVKQESGRQHVSLGPEMTVPLARLASLHCWGSS